MADGTEKKRPTGWIVVAIVVGVAIVVAVVVVVVTNNSKSSNSTHSATTAKYDPAAAELVPSIIKTKSSATGLVMAMDATYPPDEFLASDNSTIIGFDVDLGKALAVTLGLKFNATNITFANIIPQLQTGQSDIGNSSFTDSKEREKQLNFVDYFQAGEAFYVKKSSTIVLNTLAELCGHSVAVETGTVEQTDAQTQATKCPSSSPISVVSYPTQSDANSAVASGRQEAGFADSQVAGYIVFTSHGTFKLAGSAFNINPYGIAVAKTTSFDKAIQAAMNDLIHNGVYMRILKHWGVQDGAVSTATINGAIS